MTGQTSRKPAAAKAKAESAGTKFTPAKRAAEVRPEGTAAPRRAGRSGKAAERAGNAAVHGEISRAGLVAAGVAEDPGVRAIAADKALGLFHPITAQWFRAVFDGPTAPQIEGWPAIARGESTLILAPTGTGKTLTAFLWCLDKLMLQTSPQAEEGCRVLYLSPLKALAADVERNLRSPLAGIANMA